MANSPLISFAPTPPDTGEKDKKKRILPSRTRFFIVTVFLLDRSQYQLVGYVKAEVGANRIIGEPISIHFTQRQGDGRAVTDRVAVTA